MKPFTSLFLAPLNEIKEEKYWDEAGKMLSELFSDENQYGSAIGNPDFGVVDPDLLKDKNFQKEFLRDTMLISSNGPEGTMLVGIMLFDMSTDENTNKRTLKIEGLYIKPECRGNGLAYAAVKVVEAAMSPDYLRLDVLPNNLPAVKLYQKLGFKTVMLEMVLAR